jgi:Tfp pilus assembly protein PilF
MGGSRLDQAEHWRYGQQFVLKKKYSIVIILLALFTLLALWPVTEGGYISLDDHDYITGNYQVKSGLTVESVRWAFSSFGYASNWHPLTWLSHMLDVEIFGLNPRGHHLSNLVLHVLNVILLFLVLSSMTGAFKSSAFAAALFAIHPLHVESVAWISERKDVLSTFFWILTMSAYLGYVRKPGAGRYLSVVACLTLGLLSKPMVVTLPFVLLLLDYWPLGRLAPPGDARTKAEFVRHLQIIAEKLPLFVLAGASSVITFMAQSKGGAVSIMDSSHSGLRWSAAAVSYVRYLVKAVWPSKLAIFYPSFKVDTWQVAVSAIILSAVTVLVIRKIVKYPFLAVGWFWYLGTLVPVIGIVRVGAQSIADRYTYIPLIGLFILVTWAFRELGMNRSIPRAAWILPLTILMALGSMSRVQAGYWRDNYTLFTHAVQVTSNNWLAHGNLGLELYNRGEMHESLAHFKESLAINDSNALVHTIYGNALDDLGRSESALYHYRKALSVNPEYASAHFNIGVLLFQQGRLDDAAVSLRSAIRIDPRFAEAYNYLGVIQATLEKKPEEALPYFENAVRFDQENADAFFNLGLTLENMGRPQEAAEKYRRVLSIDPGHPRAKEYLSRLASPQSRPR